MSSKHEQEGIHNIDVTDKFIHIESSLFLEHLRSLRKEPSLSIKIVWDDNMTEDTLTKLKAFIEGARGQKRDATIVSTREQRDGPILTSPNSINAFMSGVKWEEIQ